VICQLKQPLLDYAGLLGRAGLLAAALGIGATLGSAGIAFAEPAGSGSRTSNSAGPSETSRPAGSAPSAEGQRVPASAFRRPGGIRIDVSVPDNPIPGVHRGGPHIDHSAGSSGALTYTATGGPADGSVTAAAGAGFTYAPSPDTRAATVQAGPTDPASLPVTVGDHQGTAADLPVRAVIDPAVTRLTASDPKSEGNLQVSIGGNGPLAASAENYPALHSRQALHDAAGAVGAAAALPGQPNAAVAVGLTTVTSSALTQSLAHSTSGLVGTVLGLDPAFFPVMGLWMDGFATSNGRKFRRVWYPNIPSRKNSELGVAALDKQLHETPGLKIVFGHSMGAQVAAKWLREKGPTSDIPASEVVFILGGNPERKYGGALLVPARPKLWGFWPIEPTYGGPGIPDDTPYTVIDYARQYDWWADAPTSLTPSRTAQLNASQAIHSDYFRVGIDDPDVLTYVEGNRIYKLKPTTIAASKRAVVEQSYSRPTG
jgi:hypothetical protein